MSSAQEIPVIVGVGQLLQRAEDPREAAEPLEMTLAVLEQAGSDSGARGLLQRATSMYVIRGLWGYGDPGRELARKLGAKLDETVSTPYGGNFSQACVIDAARAIQAGKRDVVLITGAENGRSLGQAQRLGIDLRQTPVPGAPDRLVAVSTPPPLRATASVAKTSRIKSMPSRCAKRWSTSWERSRSRRTPSRIEPANPIWAMRRVSPMTVGAPGGRSKTQPSWRR